MEIKNSLRKKQLKEFVDDNHHEVMDDFYDIYESEMSDNEVEIELRRLIEVDEYFFDSYISLADILSHSNRVEEADELLQAAYTKALMKIVDKDGNWPKELRWGYLENRHLMRVIEAYGFLCWRKGKTEQALFIFRKLLRANPLDNQGIRHYILAIRLGLDEDKWSRPFQAKNSFPGALDAFKMSDWFNRNVKKYSDEFDWWFKTNEEL
ncbi:MAG: tetratricopeptide repeat protein [Patescibacteria group bacterium]|jgi:tetratricopeptide (TPR) repeat protein|nr:tetratricopeptide repeat protein [Patescibacteria group bacterium]